MVFRIIPSIKHYVKQTGVLFITQLLVLVFGLLIKVIQTRALTPAEYGLYAFFGTVTSLSALFFRFGFFSSIKVLLANNDDEQKERELFGIGFIVATLIGIIYVAFVWGLSFFINSIFNVEMNAILRLVAPLCFILPFRFLISDISIGSNKINHQVTFDLFSSIFFLTLLYLMFTYNTLSVLTIIIFNLSSVIIAAYIVFKRFKPLYSNLKTRWQEVRKKNKEYGFPYYTGAVVNQTTYKLDEIFITYFVNINELGFYSLAGTICSPMAMLSQSMSSSIFKKLASKDRIPIKVFIYNAIWLISCVIFLYFFSDIIVQILFGEDYSIVSTYVVFLSIAYFFQGMYAPFTFLSAKSKGTEIRNVAFIETIINIVGNVILIPIYGVIGAIIASILAQFTHYIALSYYYIKYLKEIKS